MRRNELARLILVRHAETEWNRLLRYQGRSDVELNQNGIEQARKVSDRLAMEKIDMIYCSDMRRAMTTAEIIAANHNAIGPIRTSSLIREMDFGDFEGLTFEEMKERFPDVVDDRQSWRNRGPDVRAINGESISQLAQRVSRFSELLPDSMSGETALIVAHGGPLQVLICQLLEIGLEHWWQVRLKSTSVTVMETCEQGAALILLNDTCHLEEDQR